jgi:pyruvate dehydrogenase E1 component beta subunit
VPDEEYVVPIGQAEVKREGGDCSVITWGKSVILAQQAADVLAKDNVSIDIVDLRTLRPMDAEAIAKSVQKTNRAVVLEEGWPMSSYGATISDFIQRECFDDLDAPIVRVTQADVPMPYAKNLEKAAKPDVPKVVAAVRKVSYLDA